MKKLFQILLITIFAAHFAYGVDVSSITGIPSTSATQNTPMDLQISNPNTTPNASTQTMQTAQIPILPPVFGANLFNGNFTKASQSLYNPDYKIAIGDKINFRMWGEDEFQEE